jgi:hypothetical protein
MVVAKIADPVNSEQPTEAVPPHEQPDDGYRADGTAVQPKLVRVPTFHSAIQSIGRPQLNQIRAFQ